MKNRKGILGIEVVVMVAFIGTGLACLWHIPAWSKAKAEGKTKEYQEQKMWPQQEFSKIPGGEN